MRLVSRLWLIHSMTVSTGSVQEPQGVPANSSQTGTSHHSFHAPVDQRLGQFIGWQFIILACRPQLFRCWIASTALTLSNWSFFSRHDIYSWGQQNIYRQFGQFWENGEALLRICESFFFFCSSQLIGDICCWSLLFVLQRMIANTVKIVRYCRSQRFSKFQMFSFFFFFCTNFTYVALKTTKGHFIKLNIKINNQNISWKHNIKKLYDEETTIKDFMSC